MMKKLQEVLKGFNIETKMMLIEDIKTNLSIALIAGCEVVSHYTIEEILEEHKDIPKFDMKDTIEGLLSFKYVDTEFDVKHLEKLLKYKNVKSLSKADNITFHDGEQHRSPRKESIENNVVYINKEKPSTNSLAFSKQFKIEHRTILKSIFEIAKTYPSILMGVEWGTYTYVTGVNKNESITTYLEIDENTYYKLLNKMGTPKSIEMVIYRDVKQEEYFKGFQALRDLAYSNGYEEDEIERLIFIRTSGTKSLLTTIGNYVKHYNNLEKGKQLNPITVSRIIFNLINVNSGIDAKHFDGKRVDRNGSLKDIQNKLIVEEKGMEVAMNMAIRSLAPIIEVLECGANMSIDKIREQLSKYKVSHLLDEI